jgi:hypothetical protein
MAQVVEAEPMSDSPSLTVAHSVKVAAGAFSKWRRALLEAVSPGSTKYEQGGKS